VAPLATDTPDGTAAPGATGAGTAAAPSGTPGAPGAPAATGTTGATGGPTARVTPGSPTAAATARGTSAPAAPLVMEVVATSDAWLSVRVDQHKQFEGFLRAGDRKRFDANERVRLRTGNAGATQVTLNGRQLDPLGSRGEVVEREWRLLASGDIEQSS
jgi:hypothetical protein